MKKITLFVNPDNYNIRFQDYISNKKQTTHCSSIVTFHEKFPVALLNFDGNKSKTQTLKRRLQRNITMVNIYVAVDSSYLLIFDPAKSIALIYDFNKRELYASPCSRREYNEGCNSFIYNSDAVLISGKVTVQQMFVEKEFIDPREDEVTLLRRELAKTNMLNDELVADNKRLNLAVLELKAMSRKAVDVNSEKSNAIRNDGVFELVRCNDEIKKDISLWSDRLKTTRNNTLDEEYNEKISILEAKFIDFKNELNLSTADNVIRNDLEGAILHLLKQIE